MSTARNPMQIGVLLQLADEMPLPVLQQFAAQRLLSHPRFTHTVVESVLAPRRPRWRAEHGAALSEHVYAAGPEPALSPAALAQRVAQRLSQPLSFARSPWSLELLPLAGGASALLFRVHHCIADGASLVALLCALADAPPPARQLPPAPPAPRAHPAPAGPCARARQLGASLLRFATPPADRAAALHSLSGVKRVAWSSALDLASITDLAAQRACHASDLLLSATAAAVASGLRAAAAPVPASLRALVPFGGGLGHSELGNHFASLFVELPLNEPDRWRRLERVAAETRKLRDPTQTRLALALVAGAGLLAPPLMHRAVDRLSRQASLVFSNVPGPAERVHLMGHAVRSMVVFAPASGAIGISFTLFGYAGELRLGVETDAALQLPPEPLVREFEACLRAYLPSPANHA